LINEETPVSDWTAGYVADIGYTYGYYHELNPLRARLAFANANVACPEFTTACELGFGQGLSANIHAAASGVEWYGTDFNPAQAGYAQELARSSGAAAKLYDEAFGEFCNRRDLPDFDFISLHGIWSWISDENRHVIVDFVRRKLKVGGVLYISYNTQPGWASFAPMRHLMTQHAEVLGAEGRGIVNRVEGALEFASKFLDTKPLYAAANPQIAERLNKLKEQNRQYLAHEYFNRDWHPMHFATVAEWLAPAKVSFACSAHFLDQIDAIHLTPQQQQFLKDLPDDMLRQSVRDFMINAQFRRDYWVKGRRDVGLLDRSDAIRNTRVLLLQHRSNITLKVSGALGEIVLLEKIYNPVLDALESYEVKTVGQLQAELAPQGIDLSQLLQTVMVLIGAGCLTPVQADGAITKARKQCDALNMHLLLKARGNNDVATLASPVIGGGVAVNRFQQLFLLALKEGKKQPDEWASHAWSTLAAQGQKIVKDGKALETPEENLAELREQARQFADKHLAVLEACKIA
jgi:SAM-dependent methyltransferase